MNTHEAIHTITSNDHLTSNMQVAIESSIKFNTPLPIEYISNGAPIKVEPISVAHSEVSIITVGDNHFVIVPTSLTDHSLAYSSKVEKSEKQITYLARRASQPACPMELPDKLLTKNIILRNASYKYPHSEELSQQEVETQIDAYDQLAKLTIGHDDYGHMMIHSRTLWKEDFNMVLYEYEKQKKAYEWIQTQEINWEHMAKAELKWLTKSANYDMVVYEYISRMKKAKLPLISKSQTKTPGKSISSGNRGVDIQSVIYESLEPTIHELTVRKWGVSPDHQQAILEQEPLFASKCIETAREFADRLRSNYGSDCADSKIIEKTASSLQATMRLSSTNPSAWHTDLNNLLENLQFVKFLDVMHPEAKSNWLANYSREIRFDISTLLKLQNTELNQALSKLLTTIGENPSPKDTPALWFKELNDAISLNKRFDISNLIVNHPYYNKI